MTPELDATSRIIFDFCQKQKFSEARSYFEEKILEGTLDSSNPEHLLLRSSINGLSGDINEELRQLSILREMYPTFTPALFSLIRAEIKLEQYRDVVEVAHELIRIETDLAETYFINSSWFYLAFAYLKLGDRDRCISAIYKVSQVHKDWMAGRLWSKEDILSAAQMQR